MREFKYRWVAVSINGKPDLPHVDRRKADGWEPVPPDDPMCPEHNDDMHRTLVLYRKPIELANAQSETLRLHTADRLNGELESWREQTDFHVETFAETVTERPKGGRTRRLVGNAEPSATRSEILARLEDFYQPEWLARARPAGQRAYGLHGDDALAEVNELRRAINLPEWTVAELRRQLLAHWKKGTAEPFSKAPYHTSYRNAAYARERRIEWGMPATLGEWLQVLWRRLRLP